jgi:Ribonuclease G/E
MAVRTYYPEMHDPKPEGCQIHCPHCSGNGRHYFVQTSLLLSGRGITPCSWDATCYSVTKAVFDRLSKTYDISCELLLD